MLHISLQPEYVLSVYGFLISNTFLTSVAVTLVLVVFAIVYRMQINERDYMIGKGVRLLIAKSLHFIDTVTGDRQFSKAIFPLVATFFIFIITANLLGLIPGFLGSFFVDAGGQHLSVFRSPNSDLTTTIALALISVFATQYFSFKTLRAKGYISRFLNFESLTGFVTGLFEALSEAVKLLSFSFRLFGNVLAGEVVLLVAAFFMPYVLPVPFMILEIFVGILQAFIFAALTLTFIRIGTMRAGMEHEESAR